jgi:hypothetical protein
VFSFSSSLRIDYPANVIWAYLVAFEQVPLWERGVVEERQVTPVSLRSAPGSPPGASMPNPKRSWLLMEAGRC